MRTATAGGVRQSTGWEPVPPGTATAAAGHQRMPRPTKRPKQRNGKAGRWERPMEAG